MAENIFLRRVVGLIAGFGTALAIFVVATLVAGVVWPAYAAAAPTKAFTPAMLGARLITGAVGTALAAGVTATIARDNGLAAWWLGLALLACSLPIHLIRVWADYPLWYHIAYLSYLVPIAGLTGRVLARGSTDR